MVLLHPALVGRDGRAFDANAMLKNSIGRIYRDLIIRLVTVCDAQIK
jgi:hypothetical protein